jgi:hypothetical protein
MEGLLPFIYRAVVRDRSHHICRSSSSRRNLLLSSPESSNSGRLLGRDHVKHCDIAAKGDSSGKFGNSAPQEFQLKPADLYPSSQSLLHRRAVSSSLFNSGDERSPGKQAILLNFPAQFGHANSFHYRP